MNVLADAAPVTVVGGTPVVPPVLGSRSFGEPLTALVTEKLAGVAVVPVEIELELCPEGSLAVPTDVWHIP